MVEIYCGLRVSVISYNVPTEAATNDTNTTDMMGGSGMFLDITENTTMVDDVTSNVTTSSTEQPSRAGLATSEIVGIVVGVIALAILVSLLTAIVIILWWVKLTLSLSLSLPFPSSIHILLF